MNLWPVVNKPCEYILKLSKPLFAHLQKEKKKNVSVDFHRDKRLAGLSRKHPLKISRVIDGT